MPSRLHCEDTLLRCACPTAQQKSDALSLYWPKPDTSEATSRSHPLPAAMPTSGLEAGQRCSSQIGGGGVLLSGSSQPRTYYSLIPLRVHVCKQIYFALSSPYLGTLAAQVSILGTWTQNPKIPKTLNPYKPLNPKP